MRRPATGGGSSRCRRRVPGSDPAQRPAGASGPHHLLHKLLHGPGPPDPEEPGSIPGQWMGQRRPNPLLLSRPDQDCNGRTSAEKVARPAPAGHPDAAPAPGCCRLLPCSSGKARAHADTSVEGSRPGAGREPGPSGDRHPERAAVSPGRSRGR